MPKVEYPKNRWNLATEQWETKATADSEWEANKAKSKPRACSTEDFISSYQSANSYSDLARRLSWSVARVKSKRTRVNNGIAKKAWYGKLSDAKKAKFQLADLPDHTESQLTTLAAHKDEYFGTSQDELKKLFGG